jgi:mRNA interferase RelE/StbE
LATGPRPPGCRELVGANSLWRIRVGNYWVIYSIDDPRRRVDVNAVRHSSDAYR